MQCGKTPFFLADGKIDHFISHLDQPENLIGGFLPSPFRQLLIAG
jgi:hypothetical protein